MNTDSSLPPPVTSGTPSPSTTGGLRGRLAKVFENPTPTPGFKGPSESSQGTSQGRKPCDITEADILEKLNAHRRFRQPEVAQDVEITDLPAFDSIAQYDGVDEESQTRLWGQEVTRLLRAANGDDPLEFEGSPDLDVDSAKAHEVLATLADLVFQSLNIVLYDGECLFSEHEKSCCDPRILQRCRITLDMLCNRDDEDDSADNYASVSRKHRRDVFAFIDCCTALLGRVMCSIAEKKSLAVDILATLARVTTKLKVVTADPLKFAQLSIDSGDYLSGLRRVEGQGPRGQKGTSTKPPDRPEAEDGGDHGRDTSQQNTDRDVMTGRGRFEEFLGGAAGQFDAPTSKKSALRSVYMDRCSKIRHLVNETFLHLMVKLRGSNRLTRNAFRRYEICAMVYETGFERFSTLVFQDQHNYFSGNANHMSMACASHAFRILDSTVRRLDEKIGPAGMVPETPSGNSLAADDGSVSIGTRITWSSVLKAVDKMGPSIQTTATSALPPPKSLALKSMSNVISVLIPLIMTHPKFIDHLTMVLAMLSSDPFLESEAARPRPRYRVFASFCLDTEEYRSRQRSCEANEPMSLSNSLLRRNGLHVGKTIDRIGHVRSFPFTSDGMGSTRTTQARPRSAYSLTKGTGVEDSTLGIERITKHQQELSAARSKMQTWVLEEKCVMVQCRLYVSIVTALCAVLVCGGIGLGVTVGDRIEGVDPFNITTYCWVLAAFVVLVAKSIRVSNWTWNDFLHGQVQCRSVSELSSVTGIREQVIIAYLIQTEATSFLETRGPFNSVFRRRSDDGFSIDRPLSLWTMFFSGLVPIEIESVFGRGIRCLDLRWGTTADSVPQMHEDSEDKKREESQEGLACVRLEEEVVDPRSGNLRVRLKANDLKVYKVIGVYGNEETVFL